MNKDLINVTNSDIPGRHGKDGVWEFLPPYHRRLYRNDQRRGGVGFRLYFHNKGSFKNVGEVTTKEQVEQLLEPQKSDPVHLLLVKRSRFFA